MQWGSKVAWFPAYSCYVKLYVTFVFKGGYKNFGNTIYLWNFSFTRLSTYVFCYQNCSDLLWEKIVLVIEKNISQVERWLPQHQSLTPNMKKKSMLMLGQNNYGLISTKTSSCKNKSGKLSKKNSSANLAFWKIPSKKPNS